jgi:hypothetical protein
VSSELQPIFKELRAILIKQAPGFRVSEDSAHHYALEATPGPATLRAWGGQVRRARIPVAWVEIRKTYVSYHLMGVGHPKVRRAMSTRLEARMQGKTCFNFKTNDETIFRELERLTVRGLAAFREAGFISNRESA